MIYNPHAYQKYATQRIIDDPSVGLFIDMGMGKTVVTLTALVELLALQEVGKVLIIAPLRVAESTWSTEAAKWDHTRHLKISKVLGPKAARLRALEVSADIYILNRENTSWMVDYYGEAWPFDMVIIDELSSFKSFRAERFKKLKSVLPYIKRILGLTVTPAPNGLLDLWPQIYLLDKGERLGKYITHYRQKYFVPDQYNRLTGVVYSWALKSGAADQIHAAISDLCISMSVADYLTLPPRIDRIMNVELPPVARRQYNHLERDLLLPLVQSDAEAGSAAILAGKLLQLANGAVYDEHGDTQEIHAAKLDALTDIAEAANGNPLLVFYTFKHDAKRISARFAEAGCPVTILRDEQDIQNWNAGRIPILLAHPASAGHGLNLQTGGNTVVWFGLPWSLELYEQGNGRIHRQGQERPVVIYHLAAAGTIDEDVMAALEGKATGQAERLKAVKARLTA